MKAPYFSCYLQEGIYLLHYHANERDFYIAGRKRAGKDKGEPDEEEVSRGDIHILFHLSHVQRQYQDPGVSFNPILQGSQLALLYYFCRVYLRNSLRISNR